MAFESKKLAPTSVGLAGEPKLWGYSSDVDDLTTIGVLNYFLEAADKFEEGDIITVKETVTIPFNVAQYYVADIQKDAEGNPTDIIIALWSTPTGAAVTPLSVESPAFDTTDTIYLPSVIPGTITGVRATLNGTNTTSAVTLTFNINGVPMTGGTLNFGATDPAGTQLVTAITAANAIVPGSNIEVVSSGGGAAITATVVFSVS
jgi:hypothetical protein